MCWWEIEGFARLDEWEAHFRTPEGRLYTAETPVSRAMHFTRNGLYDEIIGEGPVPQGLHLIEFFDAAGHSELAIARLFREPQSSGNAGHSSLYVINRIGLLAPDPGGMALWTFANYVAAEAFIRAKPPTCPVRFVQCRALSQFRRRNPLSHPARQGGTDHPGI